MASPLVLPDWVGPTTMTECLGSAANKRPA